ncbi:MAG: cupin domain-containing protein, partial [Jatrophihabitantaceae bacterium]
MSAAELASALGLVPLPEEGGLFRRMLFDAHTSAIYYLLADGDFSALHRLASTEIYHYYDGAPLRLLLLHPDGGVEQPVLGRDVAAGQRPQVIVPAGSWQGSSSAGEWTLVGTTMSPRFEWEEFELGARAELVAQYPAAAERIVE